MTTQVKDALSATINLRDGRTLGYIDVGRPDGTPVFFLHGGADSRLTRYPDDDYTSSLGVRLIGIDRPGVGLSSFQPGRTLLDWAADSAQLADALGIDRFAVLGWSMGAPHALACAYAIPDRLGAIGVVSGLGPVGEPEVYAVLSPFHRKLFRLARRSERLVQLPLALRNVKARRDPQAYMDHLFSSAPANDRAVYDAPGVREVKGAGFAEVVRVGSRGLAYEMTMVARPWGFPLEGIQVPVQLWYGTGDRTTPLAMVRYFEARIPRTHLTLWEGEGHQMILARWGEVLTGLLRSDSHAPHRVTSYTETRADDWRVSSPPTKEEIPFHD